MKKLIVMLAVAAFAVAAQADCGDCKSDKCPSSKKECPSKGGCDKAEDGSKCPAGGDKKKS